MSKPDESGAQDSEEERKAEREELAEFIEMPFYSIQRGNSLKQSILETNGAHLTVASNLGNPK